MEPLEDALGLRITLGDGVDVAATVAYVFVAVSDCDCEGELLAVRRSEGALLPVRDADALRDGVSDALGEDEIDGLAVGEREGGALFEARALLEGVAVALLHSDAECEAVGDTDCVRTGDCEDDGDCDLQREPLPVRDAEAHRDSDDSALGDAVVDTLAVGEREAELLREGGALLEEDRVALLQRDAVGDAVGDALCAIVADSAGDSELLMD